MKPPKCESCRTTTDVHFYPKTDVDLCRSCARRLDDPAHVIKTGGCGVFWLDLNSRCGGARGLGVNNTYLDGGGVIDNADVKKLHLFLRRYLRALELSSKEVLRQFYAGERGSKGIENLIRRNAKRTKKRRKP